MEETKLFDEYLEYLEQVWNFASSTLKGHKRVCLKWEKFLITKRNHRLTKATPEDLLGWIEYRQAVVKDTTIAKELCVLSTFYRYCYNFGKMEMNPAASIPELICQPPAEKEYLTVDECFRLLDTFPGSGPSGNTSDPEGLRNYVLVALLWSTGLRSSELCALDWCDIDMDEAKLLVRKGKGQRQRQLFLNERLLDDFKRFRPKRGNIDHVPVFHTLKESESGIEKYIRLSESKLIEILHKHAQAAGISKKVTPLTLRHTFATHMFEAGISIGDIKELMGHTNNNMTAIYVHVTLNAAKRLLNEHVANVREPKGGELP